MGLPMMPSPMKPTVSFAAAAQRYLANLQFLVLGPPGTRVDGRIFAR